METMAAHCDAQTRENGAVSGPLAKTGDAAPPQTGGIGRA